MKDRVREKQASRDKDARRLATGEVTRDQLRRENALLDPCRVTIHFDRSQPLR